MQHNFQRALETLEQVKRDLSNDAKDRALEGIDEVIDLVLKAKAEGEDGGKSKETLLQSLAEILQAGMPYASLIETLIQLFK